MTGTANQNQSLFEKSFPQDVCHNLSEILFDRGVAAGFCMDRKSNIKTAICASLSRWLSIVILSLFTHFVNIHTVDHNIQDFRIGIFHADSSDVSHTLDRILDIFPHDTFARLETSVMLAHVVGENSSVNSGCNFRRTGGFCAVADNTADVSNGVDDRQTDIFISSARKIGNGGTGSTACADGAAVSGKTSNIFFLMNRNQVADNECAVQFFLGNVPFFCKLK